MRDNREFDEDEPDEMLFSLEELMSENEVDETEQFEDTLGILQEIEEELLSKSDCEELVKECISETCENSSVGNTEQNEIPERMDSDIDTSLIETKSDSIRFIEDLNLAFSKNPKMFFRESAAKEYTHASLN